MVRPLQFAGQPADLDPFDRVLKWRSQRGASRAAQAVLIALLAWLATGSPLVSVWLLATLGLGIVNGCLSRWLFARARGRGAMTLVGAGQVFAALSFASIVLVLLSAPSPAHLAVAILLLCATCLNNAMMSRGSRLATATLVGPAAGLLLAVPFLARLLGYEIALMDAVLLATGGVAFAAFIVRMAATFNSEGQVVRSTLAALAHQNSLAVSSEELALQSKQRWRMIFDHSPTARLCFDASALYEALEATGALAGARLGDRLKTRFSAIADVFGHIKHQEANQVAIDILGDNLERCHLTEATLDAFCEALNSIGEDGSLPVFLGEIVRDGGEILDVDIHIRLAPDGEAPWGLCLATYVDVSAAQHAAREQLEALEAAEVANRAKSDFLAVISHEIRTPLNGVLGMAQAMAQSPLAKAQRDRLQVISESGTALLAIVDDLLDLAKIETGRLEIVNADFDLAGLAESVHAAYAAEAARKGLSFVLDVDPQVSEIYRGDPGRIRQVLGALVANAIKFTPKGEIGLRLGPIGEGVRCEVHDTGIGIAPDRMGKLFESFVQADSSMTRRYGGAGLGLAICQQLSRAMGGEISVSSLPGQGSVFVLDLPLAPRSSTITLDEEHSSPASSMRVLAAEDNPVNQQVLKALLGQIGLDPTIVENGLEAVHAWEVGDWDLILMDVQMPVMDGETATRTIRARESELGRARTPIIAVTANAMTNQVARYLEAGVNAVVSKPISVEELFAAMIASVGSSGADGRADVAA